MILTDFPKCMKLEYGYIYRTEQMYSTEDERLILDTTKNNIIKYVMNSRPLTTY